MKQYSFSIVFWNVWMDTQFTPSSRKKLFLYLDGLLEQYNPEVIGVNEVIYDEQLKRSYLIEYFEKRGYYSHFTPFSPVSSRHTIGSGLMTKQKPSEIYEHTLGPDLPAKRRGFGDHSVKTIEALIPSTQNNRDVRVIVTYLAHLIPLNWVVHQQHYRELKELLNHQRFSKDFVMVGDFNEPKYHPNILRLGKYFKRKTGSLFAPTWRLRGKRLYLARANYDNIMWSNDQYFALDEFSILRGHPSDHAPLYAKFLLKLDLRKTSPSSGLSASDSEDVLSDGEVAIATSRAEKLLMDAGGRSGDAGILRKSSK